MRKGGMLLPLMLFVILGAFVLVLSTQLERKHQSLKDLHPRIVWLDLHLKSIKELLKIRLKDGSLTPVNFIELSQQIGDYHYTIVCKQFPSLQTTQGQTLIYYFVDVFGVYRDSSKEFLQEFSTRRSFIFPLILEN